MVKNEVKDKLWESITHFYDIEDCRRKHMMVQLGDHLRDFRRKVYAKHIKPNIGKPRKLKLVPTEYSGYVEQSHWDTFVKWSLSEKFKDLSNAAKKARAKSKYPHRLGRAGYTGLRERLVKKKELAENEVPNRAIMWMKARQDKKGDYKDDDIKDVVDVITQRGKEIEDGYVNPDQDTDALTLVFGKEHCGRVRGVGKGITPTKYWNIPRRKGSSKEMDQLKEKLDIVTRDNAKKDEEFKCLSGQMNLLVSHLTSHGVVLPAQLTATHSNSERQKSLESGLPSSTPTSTNHSIGSMSRRILCKSTKLPSPSSQQSEQQEPRQESANATLPYQESQIMTSEVAPMKNPMTSKCRLAYPDLRNIVARGTIYHSSVKQMVHGVPLLGSCYKVSVDDPIKAASFLPIQAGDLKTVQDALGSFVAWPKSLVVPDLEVHDQTTPKKHTKEVGHNKKKKKVFITRHDIKKKTRSGPVRDKLSF